MTRDDRVSRAPADAQVVGPIVDGELVRRYRIDLGRAMADVAVHLRRAARDPRDPGRCVMARRKTPTPMQRATRRLYQQVFGCSVELSLGPANDDPEEVQIEIRAAEIAQEVESAHRPGRWVDYEDLSHQEWAGWTEHANGTSEALAIPHGWRAGWLARQIFMHDDLVVDESGDLVATMMEDVRPLSTAELDGEACPPTVADAIDRIAAATDDGISDGADLQTDAQNSTPHGEEAPT